MIGPRALGLGDELNQGKRKVYPQITQISQIQRQKDVKRESARMSANEILTFAFIRVIRGCPCLPPFLFSESVKSA
jgi:hypothetical protein